MGRKGSRWGAAVGVIALGFAAGPTAHAQDSGPVELPLTVHGGRFVVPVEVAGGHPLDFVLATGNAVTVLSESVASRLGDHALMLGDIEIATDDPYTVPDRELVVDGRQLHGIIGANTLNGFDLLLDAPSGRVLLARPGPRVSWPGVALSDPIRLRIYHGVAMSVDVTLAGQRFNGSIDMGVPGVLVNEPARLKAGLDPEDTATIGLGSVTFPDVGVELSDIDVFERWDPTGSGFVIVGAPLAWECAVSISWIHSELRTCRR